VSGRPAFALLVAALLIPACSKPAPAGQAKAESRQAPDNTVVLTLGGVPVKVSTARLLAREDLTTIEVRNDVSYRRLMRYRAVPVADLLSAAVAKGASTLQVKAADGFAAEIPVSLLTRRDPSAPRAYLAIEDLASPWPALPGKRTSAGPFYLVWIGPHLQQVSAEYWPYQIVSLELKTDPSARWSALSAERVADAGKRARNGQRVFVANCLSCHQIDGEGDGRIGPDLNRPMNPTQYFQKGALHRYIRDPASLRHWPGQQMPAFGADRLSDAQIDDVIDYLSAVRRRPPS
jgi:mono/diheme cytochrome c family protein